VDFLRGGGNSRFFQRGGVIVDFPEGESNSGFSRGRGC